MYLAFLKKWPPNWTQAPILTDILVFSSEIDAKLDTGNVVFLLIL